MAVPTTKKADLLVGKKVYKRVKDKYAHPTVKKTSYRVAVLVETSAGYGRGLCRGIGLFAQEHPDWHLTYAPLTLGRSWPLWFKDWRGDGILTRISDPVLLPAVRAKRVPFVDFFDKDRLGLSHALTVDSTVAAEMAADFYMAAGFRNFAYCGAPGVWYSEWRSKAFLARLARRGWPCAVYGATTATASKRHNSAAYDEATYERELGQIAAWLRPLPKPLAVLACNDLRGVQAINACWRFGLRVPDEVAVMGVDDDEVLCNLCTPPLSSVKADCERMGYLGAQHLDALMRGRRPKALGPSLPPIDVVERASTDLIAVNDPMVAETLRYIRREMLNDISVKELVDKQSLTRRNLDNLFMKHTGLTVSGVLQRERLRRAQMLLQEGRRGVAEVARAAGFHSQAQFVATFQRKFGFHPRAFQQRTTAFK